MHTVNSRDVLTHKLAVHPAVIDLTRRQTYALFRDARLDMASLGLTELCFLLQQSVHRQVTRPPDHRIGIRVKSRYGPFEVSAITLPPP
jgi:hypothetical protein